MSRRRQRREPTIRRSARHALFVLAVSALFAGVAPSPRAEAQLSDPSFWRTVGEPEYARAAHLAGQGLYLLREFEETRRDPRHGAHEAAAILDGAIRRFSLAHELSPSEPEFLFYCAMATALWELPGPGASGGARRDDEVLALFTELRALDPGFEAMTVAFSLGIVHTRSRDFEAAAAEYHRAIARALTPDPTHWANLAEVTMLAGDVEAAVGYYEQSIAIGSVDGTAGAQSVLSLWGLSVALDRLGEHRRALETAGRALSMAGGTMAPLTEDGVFFEPAYEIHWYEGLGNAALAARADSADERERLEAASVAAFRQFLVEGGNESPWAALAQRHITEATAREGRGGRRRARR